ncbi:MAG: hypothetical protein KatS3mg053_2704 [Candidatus Roseilinea sp.]|nr:MAG: hypothetical protein KatS3mg053_2704 [Candidatus Roseilinea sp.]
MTPMISAHVLMKRLAGADPPVVVDVRDPEAYAAGHVPGAINIPLAELEDRLSELSAAALVVTYCEMEHRGQSLGERAATLLRKRGFNASALDGGLPAWQQADTSVLANTAAGAMQHMNEDHRNNLLDYARGLAGLDWAEDAEIIALDRYGFDLRVTGQGKQATARIAFDPPLTEPGQLRPAVVKLAKLARQKLAE